MALTRSLTEAVQSRLGTIQGARDSFNTAPTNTRRTRRVERMWAELRQRLRSLTGLTAFTDVPSTNHSDALDDLTWLLERLRASGVDQVIATDLTRVEFGIPVVRVRVAGLSSYLTNRRRVNQRCLRHRCERCREPNRRLLGAEHQPGGGATLLPGSTQLGPIRRGDLYRDRMLGYSAFVIIDGVFFQDRAVSPREVLDVLQDGAWVAGAASMGALRAAECWPAGMVGVGSIFRLFRRGSLQSDDEVAIAFDPSNTDGFTTVALVNVRHALRRALHARSMTPDAARRILAAAQATHYSDRTWHTSSERRDATPGR